MTSIQIQIRAYLPPRILKIVAIAETPATLHKTVWLPALMVHAPTFATPDTRSVGSLAFFKAQPRQGQRSARTQHYLYVQLETLLVPLQAQQALELSVFHPTRTSSTDTQLEDTNVLTPLHLSTRAAAVPRPGKAKTARKSRIQPVLAATADSVSSFPANLGMLSLSMPHSACGYAPALHADIVACPPISSTRALFPYHIPQNELAFIACFSRLV